MAASVTTNALTMAASLFSRPPDTYAALKMWIAQEQRLWDREGLAAYCVWCGKPGVTDLHHWLIKRGYGMGKIPDNILNQPINVVLAHNKCHLDHGQTKLFRRVCYIHKFTLGYDPAGWLDDMQSKGLLVTRPELGI